jgi:hypothetical protein
VNGGKWDGMMSQTHIGYTNWQQPEQDTMPAVRRVEGNAPAKPIEFVTHGEATTNDVVSIEAPHFSRVRNGKGLTWRVIPNLGRTLGSVTALPQGRDSTTEQDAVRLEYDIAIQKGGDLTVQLYLSPTLDTTGQGSQHIGVSIDDEPMRTLTDKLLPAPNATTLEEQRDWNEAVMDNNRILETTFANTRAGAHVIKIWRLDDNVVLQKLVASTGPIPITYLGPPEGASPGTMNGYR